MKEHMPGYRTVSTVCDVSWCECCNRASLAGLISSKRSRFQFGKKKKGMYDMLDTTTVIHYELLSSSHNCLHNTFLFVCFLQLLVIETFYNYVQSYGLSNYRAQQDIIFLRILSSSSDL